MAQSSPFKSYSYKLPFKQYIKSKTNVNEFKSGLDRNSLRDYQKIKLDITKPLSPLDNKELYQKRKKKPSILKSLYLSNKDDEAKHDSELKQPENVSRTNPVESKEYKKLKSTLVESKAKLHGFKSRLKTSDLKNFGRKALESLSRLHLPRSSEHKSSLKDMNTQKLKEDASKKKPRKDKSKTSIKSKPKSKTNLMLGSNFFTAETKTIIHKTKFKSQKSNNSSSKPHSNYKSKIDTLSTNAEAFEVDDRKTDNVIIKSLENQGIRRRALNFASSEKPKTNPELKSSSHEQELTSARLNSVAYQILSNKDNLRTVSQDLKSRLEFLKSEVDYKITIPSTSRDRKRQLKSTTINTSERKVKLTAESKINELKSKLESKAEQQKFDAENKSKIGRVCSGTSKLGPQNGILFSNKQGELNSFDRSKSRPTSSKTESDNSKDQISRLSKKTHTPHKREAVIRDHRDRTLNKFIFPESDITSLKSEEYAFRNKKPNQKNSDKRESILEKKREMYKATCRALGIDCTERVFQTSVLEKSSSKPTTYYRDSKLDPPKIIQIPLDSDLKPRVIRTSDLSKNLSINNNKYEASTFNEQKLKSNDLKPSLDNSFIGENVKKSDDFTSSKLKSETGPKIVVTETLPISNKNSKTDVEKPKLSTSIEKLVVTKCEVNPAGYCEMELQDLESCNSDDIYSVIITNEESSSHTIESSCLQNESQRDNIKGQSEESKQDSLKNSPNFSSAVLYDIKSNFLQSGELKLYNTNEECKDKQNELQKLPVFKPDESRNSFCGTEAELKCCEFEDCLPQSQSAVDDIVLHAKDIQDFEKIPQDNKFESCQNISTDASSQKIEIENKPKRQKIRESEPVLYNHKAEKIYDKLYTTSDKNGIKMQETEFCCISSPEPNKIIETKNAPDPDEESKKSYDTCLSTLEAEEINFYTFNLKNISESQPAGDFKSEKLSPNKNLKAEPKTFSIINSQKKNLANLTNVEMMHEKPKHRVVKRFDLQNSPNLQSPPDRLTAPCSLTSGREYKTFGTKEPINSKYIDQSLKNKPDTIDINKVDVNLCELHSKKTQLVESGTDNNKRNSKYTLNLRFPNKKYRCSEIRIRCYKNKLHDKPCHTMKVTHGSQANSNTNVRDGKPQAIRSRQELLKNEAKPSQSHAKILLPNHPEEGKQNQNNDSSVKSQRCESELYQFADFSCLDPSPETIIENHGEDFKKIKPNASACPYPSNHEITISKPINNKTRGKTAHLELKKEHKPSEELNKNDNPYKIYYKEKNNAVSNPKAGSKSKGDVIKSKSERQEENVRESSILNSKLPSLLSETVNNNAILNHNFNPDKQSVNTNLCTGNGHEHASYGLDVDFQASKFNSHIDNDEQDSNPLRSRFYKSHRLIDLASNCTSNDNDTKCSNNKGAVPRVGKLRKRDCEKIFLDIAKSRSKNLNSHELGNIFRTQSGILPQNTDSFTEHGTQDSATLLEEINVRADYKDDNKYMQPQFKKEEQNSNTFIQDILPESRCHSKSKKDRKSFGEDVPHGENGVSAPNSNISANFEVLLTQLNSGTLEPKVEAALKKKVCQCLNLLNTNKQDISESEISDYKESKIKLRSFRHNVKTEKYKFDEDQRSCDCGLKDCWRCSTIFSHGNEKEDLILNEQPVISLGTSVPTSNKKYIDSNSASLNFEEYYPSIRSEIKVYNFATQTDSFRNSFGEKGSTKCFKKTFVTLCKCTQNDNYCQSNVKPNFEGKQVYHRDNRFAGICRCADHLLKELYSININPRVDTWDTEPSEVTVKPVHHKSRLNTFKSKLKRRLSKAVMGKYGCVECKKLHTDRTRPYCDTYICSEDDENLMENFPIKPNISNLDSNASSLKSESLVEFSIENPRITLDRFPYELKTTESESCQTSTPYTRQSESDIKKSLPKEINLKKQKSEAAIQVNEESKKDLQADVNENNPHILQTDSDNLRNEIEALISELEDIKLKSFQINSGSPHIKDNEIKQKSGALESLLDNLKLKSEALEVKLDDLKSKSDLLESKLNESQISSEKTNYNQSNCDEQGISDMNLFREKRFDQFKSESNSLLSKLDPLNSESTVSKLDSDVLLFESNIETSTNEYESKSVLFRLIKNALKTESKGFLPTPSHSKVTCTEKKSEFFSNGRQSLQSESLFAIHTERPTSKVVCFKLNFEDLEVDKENNHTAPTYNSGNEKLSSASNKSNLSSILKSRSNANVLNSDKEDTSSLILSSESDHQRLCMDNFASYLLKTPDSNKLTSETFISNVLSDIVKSDLTYPSYSGSQSTNYRETKSASTLKSQGRSSLGSQTESKKSFPNTDSESFRKQKRKVKSKITKGKSSKSRIPVKL